MAEHPRFTAEYKEKTLSDYQTEEQQVEDLKRWWKEYGLSIITGVVLAIVIIFGWRFYKQYTTQKAEGASIIYERMMIDVMNGDTKDAAVQASVLLKDFTSVPYSKIAALVLAKQYVAQNKYNLAIKQLTWVIKHAKRSNSAFAQIAQIRLARIYVQQKKADQALGVLKKTNDSSFMGLIAEVRGDAYLQLKQKDKARAAYQEALKNIPNSNKSHPLLQMKLDDL